MNKKHKTFLITVTILLITAMAAYAAFVAPKVVVVGGKEPYYNISNSTTLTNNSQTAFPTEYAVKSYVDSQVASAQIAKAVVDGLTATNGTSTVTGSTVTFAAGGFATQDSYEWQFAGTFTGTTASNRLILLYCGSTTIETLTITSGATISNTTDFVGSCRLSLVSASSSRVNCVVNLGTSIAGPVRTVADYGTGAAFTYSGGSTCGLKITNSAARTSINQVQVLYMPYH